MSEFRNTDRQNINLKYGFAGGQIVGLLMLNWNERIGNGTLTNEEVWQNHESTYTNIRGYLFSWILTDSVLDQS